MKIGFIGAGKVGSAFGHLLKDRGLDVVGYTSRSEASARQAAVYTATHAYDFNQLVSTSDFIFITTPDDVISEVWNKLKHLNLQDKRIFHMSGAISSEVFSGIDETKCFGYSLHPLFPFSDIYNYEGLGTAYFTLEGKNISAIEDFLCMSKINYFEIDGEDKAKYHAAAVFSSNYIVTLAYIGKKLLAECGIDEKKGEKALFPLIQSAVKNIEKNGTEAALTGPLMRGDIKTISAHREVLGKYTQIYDSLAKVSLDIVRSRNQITEEQLMKIESILRGE